MPIMPMKRKLTKRTMKNAKFGTHKNIELGASGGFIKRIEKPSGKKITKVWGKNGIRKEQFREMNTDSSKPIKVMTRNYTEKGKIDATISTKIKTGKIIERTVNPHGIRKLFRRKKK